MSRLHRTIRSEAIYEDVGASRKEDAMYAPLDDDEGLVDLNGDAAGAPDPKSADSFALWLCGLLESPLDPNTDSNREEENLEGRDEH